jgi:hypothetical protein
LLAVLVAGQIINVMEIIQFQSDIGPLAKIVEKMTEDFSNFMILYVVLILMFAIVGNSTFLFDLKEYEGLFQSCLTVLEASIGNFDFDIYKRVTSDLQYLGLFGNVYTMTIVISFKILILNLIVAILSNTYNMFDTQSSGLFLSKILNSRDEMAFDENYGAFLLGITPVNLIVLPFVPFAMFMKPSPRVNNFLTIL